MARTTARKVSSRSRKAEGMRSGAAPAAAPTEAPASAPSSVPTSTLPAPAPTSAPTPAPTPGPVVSIVRSNYACTSNNWLGHYSPDPLECLAQIRAKGSACNQQYFNHAGNGDGNCGCVTDTSKDCSVSSNQTPHTVVNIMMSGWKLTSAAD